MNMTRNFTEIIKDLSQAEKQITLSYIDKNGPIVPVLRLNFISACIIRRESLEKAGLNIMFLSTPENTMQYFPYCHEDEIGKIIFNKLNFKGNDSLPLMSSSGEIALVNTMISKRDWMTECKWIIDSNELKSIDTNGNYLLELILKGMVL